MLNPIRESIYKKNKMDFHQNSQSSIDLSNVILSFTTNCDQQQKQQYNNFDHKSQSKNWTKILDRRKILLKNSIFLLIIAVLLSQFCAVSSHSVNINTAIQSNNTGDISTPIIAVYVTSNRTVNFTHLAIDATTEQLYVGASNLLLQLSSNLTIEDSIRTGPIADSPLCSPTDCAGVSVAGDGDNGENSVTLRNNINQLLVIDKHSSTLLACGTVHQGTCRRHRLGAISSVDELPALPVASNDETNPIATLAFTAPARYSSGEKPVLYVAVTNSRLGPYRDMVPAIAARTLETGSKYLSVIEKSFTDSAKLDIEFHLRDYFLVHYVTGFATSDYVYFATVQKRSPLRAHEEWGYVSRLARVCQSDPGFHTYTETSLECHSGNVHFSLLQDGTVVEAGEDLSRIYRVSPRAKLFVGVFSAPVEHTNTPATKSAICVFALADIEAKFAQNIRACYNGSIATRNMDYIAGNLPECPSKGNAQISSFCAETLKINGSIPIVASSAIVYESETLTSISGQLTPTSYNVLFVGTSKGHLKKLLLSSPRRAEEFESVVIDDGQPILADMIVSPNGKHLYVASPYKIAKVLLEHCPSYGTCRNCLSSRNPYCGWCSLQKSCTVRSKCIDQRSSTTVASTVSRWLSVDSNRCVEFQSIYPEFLPINSLDRVKLVINQLPRLPRNVSYQCVFGGRNEIEAEPMPNGLICQSPPVHQRPKLLPEQDFVTLDLSIRPSDSKTEFLQRKFIFYDCNFYKTCSGCVQSRWGCQWCFKENRCVSSGYLCSAFNNNTSLLPSSLSSSSSSISGSSSLSTVIRTKESCPSFNLERNRLLNLSLPNGVQREITLPVQNLAFGNVAFGCVIEIEGSQTYVSARVENGNIICSSARFAYSNESATGQATVTAVWNRVKHIDQVNVTLYKCRYLGAFNERPDCSICLNLPSEYECGWCSGQCSHRSECSAASLADTASTLCPPPRIDWIHPLSGPVQGGTLVTVEGSNLGTSLDEIRDKVLIGGYPCRVQNMSISVRFTCITQPVQKPLLADVVIGNRAGFTTARDKFYYALPEIVASYPAIGPQSGGTRLYITGNNLSTGSSLQVWLDDLPCIVDKMLASSSQISCRTTAAPPTVDPTRPYEIQRLRVIIDNATLSVEQPFRYLPDPTIMRIFPLKSFVSGGRSLTVIGTNLESIQQPRMAVFSTEGQFINDTVCEVISTSQMICLSPPVDSALLELIYREHMGVDAQIDSSEQKMSLRVGFLMDGVVAVRDLATHYPTLHSELTYVPDPKVFAFEEGIKDLKGETLVIEGEFLRLASSDSELNITIGTAICNLTSLAMSQLVCIPPEEAPDATDETGRRVSVQLPLVVVRIGSTFRQELGYLRYDSSRRAYELSFVTISFGLVFSVILIVFVGVSFVFMRHKSLLAEREYKRIQMQMDTLENSVRSECKQAFAELQTDMTDLSHDLEAGTGTPVLDHRTYVMKVFFPGVDDHPLLVARSRIPSGPNSHLGATLGPPGSQNACYNIYELAMAQFEQLIHNKSFLLCFIGTLEASPTFNIRDRVNVASLLMIILMERMEYASDILRTLVLQLVEKSVTSRYPQLMLRRTESIVEKMLTNWLALTMYDYLKSYAGGRLFMLFSALKHQIEKGPIDALTHDARYSLSEERLLREHYSNSEQIVVNIFRMDAPMEKHPVRCNDCDTITQLKAKVLDALWKAVPFSSRPSVNDVDLEWRDPLTGIQILLQDFDQSSTRDHNSWQRMNTLKHYGIKSGALIMIVGRAPVTNHIYHQPTTTLSRGTLYCGTKKSSSFYPLLAASPNSCSSSYPSSDVDNSDHSWHLVKPTSDDASKESSSSSSGSVLMTKAIPEIFLTRLLSTKGTIQKFVDDFFCTILTVNENLPISIKWIFDLLDEAALIYGIDEPEIIHAWKSNCLPLRFWVNFIKNPNFIVDVNKTPTLDSNLSVIAQTLMDSCSSADPRLGKDSPSSKLLFAKDIVNYRKTVLQFYEDIYRAPPIREQTLSAYMQNLSLAHQGEFDSVCALKELFVYAVKYSNEMVANLQQCDYITQQTCLDKFINLINYKF